MKNNIKRIRLKYHLKKRNVVGLPRLVITRTNKNIFTQLVDDSSSTTIVSSSSIDKDLQSQINEVKNKIEKSVIVGKAIAEKMKNKKIKKIIFDRNGYKYHGRVKAVGDTIRSSEIEI